MKLNWEGLTFTFLRRWVNADASCQCQGCENPSREFQIFRAVESNGKELFARWCPECVNIVAGQSK